MSQSGVVTETDGLVFVQGKINRFEMAHGYACGLEVGIDRRNANPALLFRSGHRRIILEFALKRN
jgi:hypothetical protein